MAGDVVNLRQARKARERQERERQAEQNRLSYGRSKAEKTLTGARNDKAKRDLDQSKLERPASDRKTEQSDTGGDGSKGGAGEA